MKLVIDTCSLLNIVRNFLPFDTNDCLFNVIKNGIESNDLIIIDKVYKQCTYTSKGIVTDTLPFLKEHQIKTVDLLPDRRIWHYLDNDFKNNDVCKKLTEEEFDTNKSSFVNDADVKMLLYCYHNKDELYAPKIVTDESGVNNDNKCFKKLPMLCKTLGIEVMDTPTFLKEIIAIDYSELNK